MFIGTAFFYAHVGKLKPESLIFVVAGLFALFCILWHFGPYASTLDASWSYGFAVVTFAFAAAFPQLFRERPITEFFARISYPLYVVHGAVGYALMRVLIDRGLPTYLTILLAFGVAIGLAYALHILVEKPAQMFGKTLSVRIGGAGRRVIAS